MLKLYASQFSSYPAIQPLEYSLALGYFKVADPTWCQFIDFLDYFSQRYATISTRYCSDLILKPLDALLRNPESATRRECATQEFPRIYWGRLRSLFC